MRQHWRRDVSICSDTLTRDDLSVCQSFFSQKSIQSILQPRLTANFGLWTRLDTKKYTAACVRGRKGTGRRKRESRIKPNAKQRRKLTGDCNLKCVFVWWQCSKLLLLLNVYLAEPQLASAFGHSLQPDIIMPVCACDRLIMHGRICCIVSECQGFGVCVYQGQNCWVLPQPLQHSFTQSGSISAMTS